MLIPDHSMRIAPPLTVQIQENRFVWDRTPYDKLCYERTCHHRGDPHHHGEMMTHSPCCHQTECEHYAIYNKPNYCRHTGVGLINSPNLNEYLACFQITGISRMAFSSLIYR